MSNIPVNKNVLPDMAIQSKTSYWCEVTKTWNVKVYAAVRSTPFIVKASKEGKIAKSKKPKKASKKTVEVNDFHRMLFKDFPLFLPDSPPFSDGQINEFQCQHCGIHKDLDDETWNACPYAIFHGLMKNGDDQRDNQSPVFSSSPNPKPKKFKEKPSKKETEQK